MHSLRPTIVFLASLVMTQSAYAQTPLYHVTNLGPYIPKAINSVGHVVMVDNNNSYLWRPTGLTQIPIPAGYSKCIANGLNSNDEICGNLTSSVSGGDRAFWYHNGSITILGTLGGDGSRASAINDFSEIVGYSIFAGTEWWNSRAFHYLNGTMTGLIWPPPINSSFSAANAINQDGDIVGYRYCCGLTLCNNCAVLDRHGVFFSINSGGYYTTPTSLNSLRQVAGYAWTGIDIGNQFAFYWQSGSSMNLGTLGGASSAARALNDGGTVVGTASLPAGGGGRAFRWNSNLGMQNLNSLLDGSGAGIVLADAYGINNVGQIICTGSGGGATGFLLTPNSYAQIPGSEDPPTQAVCNGLPSDYCPTDFNLDPDKDHLVIITHGWQCSCALPYCPEIENGPEKMWDIASAIRDRIDLESDLQPQRWQVMSLDWSALAASCSPQTARMKAYGIGTRLGDALASHNHKYVHLIAHSAGCALIEEASRRLNQAHPQTKIMCTFLDEYSTTAQVGYGATWADSYWSYDDKWQFTGGSQQYCYDVDITWLDPNLHNPTCIPGIIPSSDHGWPVNFYCRTINAEDPPASVCGGPLSPSSWTGNGFGRSMEGGNYITDKSGEPQWNTQSLPALYTGSLANRAERVLGNNPCTAIYSTMAQSSPVAIGLQLTYPSPTCPPVVDGPSFTITNCLPSPVNGEPTPEPSWINFAVDLEEGSTILQIDVEFTSLAVAQGLLSVYLDGALLISIDERYAATGVNTVTADIPTGTAAGTHPLGFRLDSFSPEVSSAIVSNVQQAKIVLAPVCESDVNADAVVNVNDLLAVINSWGPCVSCPADINHDEFVNVNDLLAVINSWGQCP